MEKRFHVCMCIIKSTHTKHTHTVYAIAERVWPNCYWLLVDARSIHTQTKIIGAFNQEESSFQPFSTKMLSNISQEAIFPDHKQWFVGSLDEIHKHRDTHTYTEVEMEDKRLIHSIQVKGYCGSQRTSYISASLVFDWMTSPLQNYFLTVFIEV